jgi:hypothetical protein
MRGTMRRWALAGVAAAVGGLLLVCGIAVAVVDAQQRSDAATAAVTFTVEQRAQLDEIGIYEAVVADAHYVRRSLILENLASGGPIPERYFEISEMEDGNVSMSWGPGRDQITFTSWGGGWQLKPTAILSFTGLSLLIGSLFVAAARAESPHPPD